MLQPLGFGQHHSSTSLGQIAYYRSDDSYWGIKPDGERPTLVFFHGFGGGSSAYEWSNVYPAFAADYQVLAPDLLGWGQSDHPARSYQVDDYLTTIAEFLEKTCSPPATVIASSLTAAMMVRIAIDRPELCKALILVAPSGLSEFGKDYAQSFFAQMVGTPIVDRLIYATGIANEFAIRNFLEQRQFAQPERVCPELVQAYLHSAQQPNADYSALSFVRGDLCFDLSCYISQLQTPTAMIWGQQAQFTGPDIGQRLAAMNPQAIRALHILDQVGLTPQLEVPAVTSGLIRQFLQILY